MRSKPSRNSLSTSKEIHQSQRRGGRILGSRRKINKINFVGNIIIDPSSTNHGSLSLPPGHSQKAQIDDWVIDLSVLYSLTPSFSDSTAPSPTRRCATLTSNYSRANRHPLIDHATCILQVMPLRAHCRMSQQHPFGSSPRLQEQAWCVFEGGCRIASQFQIWRLRGWRLVLNGWGAVAGILTGGGGASKVSDCTYVTSLTGAGSYRAGSSSLPTLLPSRSSSSACCSTVFRLTYSPCPPLKCHLLPKSQRPLIPSLFTFYGPYDLAIRIRDGARLPKAKQRGFSREEVLEVKKQLAEHMEDEHLKDDSTKPEKRHPTKQSGKRHLNGICVFGKNTRWNVRRIGGVNADGGGKRRGAYQRGWHMIRRYMKAVVRFREKLLVLVHITPSCSVSGTLTRRADDIGTSSSRTGTWTSSGRMSSSPKKPLNKKGRVEGDRQKRSNDKEKKPRIKEPDNNE